MAVTSIWPIKGRVDKVINYARNPEKTHDKERLSELHEIEGVVEYAADEMKTEKRAYVTCLNLHSEETAAQEFMEAKRLMHGLIAYVQFVENGCVYFTETAIDEYIAKCTRRAKPSEPARSTYRKRRDG